MTANALESSEAGIEDRLSQRFGSQWMKGYVRGKLRSDPQVRTLG